jgi:hypothetical protein
VLRDWRKVRAEERDGVEPKADDLVFVKADGTLPPPDVFSQLFDRTVAKLDVPNISLHGTELMVDLRWVLTHLLEETARHAGHADILRQLLDGSTGR